MGPEYWLFLCFCISDLRPKYSASPNFSLLICKTGAIMTITWRVVVRNKDNSDHWVCTMCLALYLGLWNRISCKLLSTSKKELGNRQLKSFAPVLQLINCGSGIQTQVRLAPKTYSTRGCEVLWKCYFYYSCRSCKLISTRLKNLSFELAWFGINLDPKHTGWITSLLWVQDPFAPYEQTGDLFSFLSGHSVSQVGHEGLPKARTTFPGEPGSPNSQHGAYTLDFSSLSAQFLGNGHQPGAWGFIL